MFFQRSRFMFVIAFLFVALISVGGQRIVAHAAVSGGPTFALSSQTVSPGQAITATGQGLTPQTSFQLLLGDAHGNNQRELSSIWSDSNGTFTSTFTVPQDYNILQGSYTVTLYPENSSVGQPIAQVAVTVVPALFQVPGSSGFPVAVKGAGFTASETVEVYFGANANGKDEGKARSDLGGNLSFTFTMPSGLTARDYPVTVVRTAQTPLIITGTIRLYPLTLSMVAEPGNTLAFTAVGTGFVPNEYVTLTWNANGGQVLLSA